MRSIIARVRPYIIALALLGMSIPSGVAAASSIDDTLDLVATSEQTTIKSPIGGTVTSAPGSHWRVYGVPGVASAGDWAMDIGAPGGTPVYARFTNTTGNLSLSVGAVGASCSSGNGGRFVRVDVRVDGIVVGYVFYSHLASLSQTSGSIANGARLGILASGLPNNPNCWTGPHVHVEAMNRESYSCYVRRSAGTSVGSSTHLGVLGGTYASGVNGACPAGATTPVVADPRVSISPSSGTRSTRFEGRGTRFTPSSQVRIRAYNPDGSAYPTSRYTTSRTTNSSGSFPIVWFWESGDQLGRYRIVYTDVASGKRAELRFRIREVPAAPGVPDAQANDGAVTLSWSGAAANGAPITDYQVEVRRVGDAEAAQAVMAGTSLTTIISDLTNGTAYDFRVRARNEAGWGPFSAWSSSATPAGLPGIPTALIAEPQVRSLQLSWSAPSNNGAAVNGYEVELEESGSILSIIPTNTASATVRNLDETNSYRFRVRAKNRMGWSSFSAWSDTVSPLGSSDTPGPDSSGTFVDDDSSVFESDIEWLAAAGVTRGCNPPQKDRYCPDEPVTRGQMAAFLHRALPGLSLGAPADFVDDDSSVFESDIEWLAAAGVTRGCNPPQNDRYCPDEPVTRGQMAAFLHRALPGLSLGAPADFVDDDSSVFESDIEWLAAAGVTRGCNPPQNDRYCPDEPVTRGQMAAFLRRAIGR